jgi:xanthosine utilization system XapX-like protein
VIVEELLPVASGLLIGLILGLLRSSLRVPVGFVLIIAFGVLATVVSGEYLISWSFLLIDIPLVAVSAAASLFVTHRLRETRRSR